MIVEEPVQAAIWHCLNHYAYSDAVFLAERLHAEVDTEDSLFLLATAYYRYGKSYQAYALLKDKGSSLKHPQCRYLLAKCATDLDKYAEAESAICGGNFPPQMNLDEIVSEFGEHASFALQLLAFVFCKTERGPKANEAFKRALKLNPFLWTCFVDLCNKGETPDPNKTFQLSGLENFSTCHGTGGMTGFTQNHNVIVSAPQAPLIITQQHVNFESDLTPPNTLQTPMMHTPNQILHACNTPMKPFIPEENPSCLPLPVTRYKPERCRNIFGENPTQSPFSPSFGILPLDTPSPLNESLEVVPLSQVSQTALTEANNDQKSFSKRVKAHVGQFISRREGPLQQTKPVFSQSSNISVVAPQTHTGQNVRRSSRLFSNSYSVKENNKSPNQGKFVTPKLPSRKTKQRLAKTNLNKTSFNELHAHNLKADKEKIETITSEQNVAVMNSTNQVLNQQEMFNIQKQCAEGLMSLLCDLGKAYQHISQYNCRKAIECLKVLPSRQYNTSWVLSMLGLAHFEMAEWQQAIQYFKEIHEKEPNRIELMDYYSTALWHTQKEVSLSALAQDLMALDKSSAITWCVVGNCFSLQKEHDTAIKFLKRAVQIDPKYTYAYTLLGHEFVMTEELDKAMSCFRNAVRCNPRHYNAWFGIGSIYSKQERFELAEIHYRRALAINRQSPVLMCHIGVVQHALKKTDAALQTLDKALQFAPRNAICKFHRGSIYFAAGRHAEALAELEELKRIVPKESLVYYLIGKIHKKLGNTDLALMHFSWATDLDPKGASSQIKEAFEPTASAANRSQNDSCVAEGVVASPSTSNQYQNDIMMRVEREEEVIEEVGINESDDSL